MRVRDRFDRVSMGSASGAARYVGIETILGHLGLRPIDGLRPTRQISLSLITCTDNARV